MATRKGVHHKRIRIFNSQGKSHKKALQTFLDCTNQKRNVRHWLHDVINRLPTRKVFIDAGAGNGEVTKALARHFTRTIAIESNIYFLDQLQHTLPRAEVIGLPILAAQPATQGDLILCSHAFYYIPRDEWLVHLERLVSWMSPTGVTIVVLQHRENGCMNMLHHFFGHRFELREVADAFLVKHEDQYDLATTLGLAHVETPDLDKAYSVAEFMLNMVDIKCAPTRQAVEAYLHANFRRRNGGYRIPVHQDFLVIRHRARIKTA